MPRKTIASSGLAPRTLERFNEAAAECRGKQVAMPAPKKEAGSASMRPRLSAAENPLEAVGADVLREASMRPRLSAAENVRNRPERTPFAMLQ